MYPLRSNPPHVRRRQSTKYFLPFQSPGPRVHCYHGRILACCSSKSSMYLVGQVKSAETTVVTSSVPSLRHGGANEREGAVILGLRRLSMSREMVVTDILRWIREIKTNSVGTYEFVKPAKATFVADWYSRQ